MLLLIDGTYTSPFGTHHTEAIADYQYGNHNGPANTFSIGVAIYASSAARDAGAEPLERRQYDEQVGSARYVAELAPDRIVAAGGYIPLVAERYLLNLPDFAGWDLVETPQILAPTPLVPRPLG